MTGSEYTEAWRNNEATETLWQQPDSKVVVLAPHGGDIEFGTDDAAARIHKKLRSHDIPVTTWMRHGFGEDAFNQFHLTSNKIKEDTYPKLSEISSNRYKYAISLHMQDKDEENGGFYVGVGGRISGEVRKQVAGRLRERLPDSKQVRWRHDRMQYKGNKKSNVVNWITEDGDSGLQIEMTPVTAYRFRKRVARAVVDVYKPRL